MSAYPGNEERDLQAQKAKKTLPHHMVACFEDACVHWVPGPGEELFHYYHGSCQADVKAGTDYRITRELLSRHMDTCGSEAPAEEVESNT